jgi:hypothetical protein
LTAPRLNGLAELMLVASKPRNADAIISWLIYLKKTANSSNANSVERLDLWPS